jgi:hypothetical protein
MASTFAVTRNHLVFGICLPVAVLLGYTLADIQDSASLTVIFIALAVLAIPVLMKWYHPLLVLGWNAALLPALPGRLHFWVFVAMLGLFFAVLNRSVNPQSRFLQPPALTRPVLALTAVVLITAMLTGGIGLRALGSQSIGGKNYIYVLAAVAGFFALSSRPIPEHRAYLFLAMFFLPGLTSLVSRFALWTGIGIDYVGLFFPLDAPIDALGFDQSTDLGATRINSVVLATTSVFCWILARYGIAGTFDFTKPWRFLALVGTVFLGMFGGFRSALLLVALIFFILFCLERLWQTRILWLLVGMMALGGTFLVSFSDKLPWTVQRTLSFLPIDIDPLSKQSAESSTQWRVEMWHQVLPQVPNYLFKGKGYVISADELFMAQEASAFGHGASHERAALAGDYHNGLLSIVIPFGLYGVAAFFWLVIAGARFLYRMYQDSAPELRQINAFLLALFLARILFFVFIYGSLALDLFNFLGILGFSVALNVNVKRLQPTLADDEIAPV